ncbi:MAG: hypothetical protein AB1637_08375 [Elusimicrobiota bacterium]
MKCQDCGKENFSVLLKVLYKSRIKTLKLCDLCAKKRGYSYEQNPPSAGDYAEKIIIQEYIPQKKKKLRCPSCSVPYSEFSSTGILGCPLCYFYFRKELKSVFEKTKKEDYKTSGEFRDIKYEALLLNKQRKNIILKKVKICLHFNDFKTAEKLKKELEKLENEEL